VYHRGRWQLRSVTFAAGPGFTGIACDGEAGQTALLALLAGQAAPTRGELRVLGADMHTHRGRAEIRRRVALVPPPGRPRGFTVHGLVTYSAWLLGVRAARRHARVTAALDRLNLAGWANCPVAAVPEDVARRAWLAACTTGEPEPDLLLVDGLLDGIKDEDAVTLAACLRTVGAGATVLAGRDATRLGLCCGRLCTLTGGIATDG